MAEVVNPDLIFKKKKKAEVILFILSTCIRVLLLLLLFIVCVCNWVTRVVLGSYEIHGDRLKGFPVVFGIGTASSRECGEKSGDDGELSMNLCSVLSCLQ